MTKVDRVCLKHDLGARLLLAPDDPCEDIHRRYPDLSARAFRRYLRDGMAAAVAPAKSLGQSDDAARDIVTPAVEPPMVRGRPSIQDVENIYLETAKDADWMRNCGLHPDGTIASVAWLDASLKARQLLLETRSRYDFDHCRDCELELERFLAAADAQSADVGELCSNWVRTFELKRGYGPPFDRLDIKLQEALLDAQLTRPAQLGGGASRCTPVDVQRSIKYRLRAVRTALKLIDLYWDPRRPGAFWRSLGDWVLSLDGAEQIAVMQAMAAARANP